MTPTDYMNQFDRTASKDFHYTKVPGSITGDMLVAMVVFGEDVDKIKKSLFMGRDFMTEFPDLDFDTYEGIDHDFLHAVLGTITETAELAELLIYANTTDPDQLRLKVVDEGGDLLWYLTLLFKRYGITLEEVMEKNIAKLAVRYPDAFSSSADLNRNEEKELAAIR